MNTLLVTGGCGFIGANFIRHVLTNTDFDGKIINLDSLTYAGNPESLGDLADRYPGRYHLERADIRRPEETAAVFDRHDVDTVCHFAAESHVDRSIAGPDDFLHTNITGTFHLLEICRRRDRIRRFHHISTDEVFGSLGKTGLFSEKTPYNPSSPYSASKAASDHLARAWHRTYGLPVTLSNCSNNYGPYQFPEKLIPLMILRALDGKSLPVYGDGGHIRDWLHVTDHCRAIWDILCRGINGETYCIGGRCEKTNLEVVEEICALADCIAPRNDGASRRDRIRFVTDRPGHDRRYAIDDTKIRKELGWQPRYDFSSGLAQTMTWYQGNMEWVQRIKSGAYREWMHRWYKERGA